MFQVQCTSWAVRVNQVGSTYNSFYCSDSAFCCIRTTLRVKQFYPLFYSPPHPPVRHFFPAVFFFLSKSFQFLVVSEKEEKKRSLSMRYYRTVGSLTSSLVCLYMNACNKNVHHSKLPFVIFIKKK